MDTIMFSRKYENCQEIKHELNEDGLLVFTVPKKCTKAAFATYFKSLNKEEVNEIVATQKKMKEVFRKKVDKMIVKYRNEFNLPFLVNLRLATKTKKINDCNVTVHGITFDGNMQLVSVLQYVPDNIVEKIVRCTVYMMAVEYEEITDSIKGVTVGSFKYPEGEINKESYNASKELKYRIPISFDEVDVIRSDYNSAVDQLLELMDKNPISHT